MVNPDYDIKSRYRAAAGWSDVRMASPRGTFIFVDIRLGDCATITANPSLVHCEAPKVEYRLHPRLRYKRRFRSLRYFAQSLPVRRFFRIYTLSSLFVLCFAIAFSPAGAYSQDWKFVKGIKVGDQAQLAVSLRDRNEIYVANPKACNLTVISTFSNEVVTTIELGKSPMALATDRHGTVYVLAQDRVGAPCVMPDDDGTYSMGIVNTGNHAVESWVNLPGNRWGDLALTGDGRRLFMTLVTPFDASGVYVFDTVKRSLQTDPVIPARARLCAVNLALAERQNELFVSYQCHQPGGHDPIGIYCLAAKDTCRSAYDEIASFGGFPNVGGRMVISPDESYLWEYGIDACSQPAYDHKGCPGNDPAKGKDDPTRILNLIDTDSLVVRTYPFPVTDDSAFVSFSPELEAYIGGLTGIKVMKKPGVGSPEPLEPLIPNDEPCHNLNVAGQINFSQAGNEEFMYAVAGSAGAVCVFKRPAKPQIAQAPPSERPVPPGKMYAIVVGINSYMFLDDQLKYPASDAAKVAAALAKNFGFSVTTLPPTPNCAGSGCYVMKKQILDAFNDLLFESPGKRRDFAPQDQVFIYLSGHGYRFESKDLSSHHFLVTSDSMGGSSDAETAATELDLNEIWDLLESSNIRHVLFVVDACYAGLNSPADFGGPTFQIALQDGKPFMRARSLPEALARNAGFTRKYLSASPFATEQVPDHSIFAERFVQALDTLRTNAAGYFTFEGVLTQMVNLDPQPRPNSFSVGDTAHGDFLFIPHAVAASQQRIQSTPAAP
jgi:hypothetical protein